MKIIQSGIVFAFLLLSTSLLVFFTAKIIRKSKEKFLYLRHIVTSVICFTLFIACILTVGEYVNPFDQTVDTKLFAVIQVEDKESSVYSEQPLWYCVYKGSSDPDSMFDIEAETIYKLKRDYMNLNHRSYIITYGLKIEELTYNVWNTMNNTYMTGSKVGNIVFEDTFEPQVMYVYEIPKLRIDNDVNKTLITSYKIPPARHVFWPVFSICLCNLVLELALMLIVEKLDTKGKNKSEKNTEMADSFDMHRTE